MDAVNVVFLCVKQNVTVYYEKEGKLYVSHLVHDMCSLHKFG